MTLDISLNKTKAHILSVEDESLLYRRLKKIVTKANYSIATYTPSVKEALLEINRKRPDLILLDIQLQGKQTGIDLGRLLDNEYHIPFIYVTDYDDDETFHQAKDTHQAHYFVKTKPKLNAKELLRVIQTTLFNNQNKREVLINKTNIIGFVDYIENTKQLGNKTEHQKTVELNNISIFTTNSEELDINKTKIKGKDSFVKLKPNYVRFVDWQKNSLYLPFSLKTIYLQLPQYFAQISDDVIINLLPDELTGIINGSKIKVKDTIYTISPTYKKEVQNRINALYLTSKNIDITSKNNK